MNTRKRKRNESGGSIKKVSSSGRWCLLPGENLQQVFRHLEIFDVEKCLLVCKNWYDEANYFLKDKICFATSNVENIEHIAVSRRRFQIFRVTNSEFEIPAISDVKILEALKQRNMKFNDPVLEAYIQYKDYRTLSKILQSLGKQIQCLHLVNFVNETPAVSNSEIEGIFQEGLQREYANLDFGNLSSVEDLRIWIIDNGLLNISRHFGNLKSLTLNSRFTMTQDFLSIQLLQDFIGLNPGLKKLHLLEGFLGLEVEGRALSVRFLLNCGNSRNLESLHFMTVSHDQDIEDIAENFKNLKALEISEMSDTHLNPWNVRRINELPKLERLSILSSSFGSFWEESLSYTKNYKLTHLTLNGDDLGEPALIACTKSLPNIKYFNCHQIISFSILLLKEMAKNWSRLEVLTIGFEEQSFEPSNSKEVVNFQSLNELNFNQLQCDSSMLEFFTCFKAVNLKKLSLNILFYEELSKDDLKQNFALLSENCPNVEFLKYSGEGTEMDATVLHSFPNVKILHVSGWFDNSSDEDQSVVSALESILSIRKERLKVILEVDYLSGLEEFCKQKGALSDYKDDLLKRIIIDNKEFLFKT